MQMVRDAIAGDRVARIAFGGRQAAAHRLHVGDQINEVLDGRFVFLEAHRIGQRERQTEREFRLGEPAVEVVP